MTNPATPPTAGPAGSASSAATDPGPPTAIPPAPSPGAPTADANNLLTIVVPQDCTVLQMGASATGPDTGVAAISGFRVSTATHAHITAQTPATTISLGAAGGAGMGGTGGLSLYSAGNKDERITGTVYEQYGNTRETHVTGNATEWWNANLSVYVAGETSETWIKAHKMNSQDTRKDEVNGECTQIYHSDLTQTMYGKVETTISKTWGTTVTGNIEIKSTAGTITIESPTNINCECVEHRVNASGFKLEFFGSENAVGIQKFEACGIDIAVTGSKNEAVGLTMEKNGVKMESTGLEVGLVTTKVEVVGAEYHNKPIEIELKDLHSSVGAFASLTAAFMKFG